MRRCVVCELLIHYSYLMLNLLSGVSELIKVLSQGPEVIQSRDVILLSMMLTVILLVVLLFLDVLEVFEYLSDLFLIG